MLHRAVGQSPGITLHAGWQPARQLEGKGLTIIALLGGFSHYYPVILTSAHFKTISRQLPKKTKKKTPSQCACPAAGRWCR